MPEWTSVHTLLQVDGRTSSHICHNTVHIPLTTAKPKIESRLLPTCTTKHNGVSTPSRHSRSRGIKESERNPNPSPSLKNSATPGSRISQHQPLTKQPQFHCLVPISPQHAEKHHKPYLKGCEWDVSEGCAESDFLAVRQCNVAFIHVGGLSACSRRLQAASSSRITASCISSALSGPLFVNEA